MLAAVDVGTNTIRLLIGTVADGKVQPQRYYRRITRLGGGYSELAGLTTEAQERTLAALHEVKQILSTPDISSVGAIGTEILRRAVNADEFLFRVRQETSIPLVVIDGDEEARLSSAGVLSALDPRPQSCLVFDLGGGSTEFILIRQGKVCFRRSYRLGVVTLAERFRQPSRQAAVIDDVLDQLVSALEAAQLLGEVEALHCQLIGTAGTVTTLAALCLGMKNYDWRRVNNLKMPLGELLRIQQQLLSLTEDQRESLPGMEKGRGDLILPGLLVVLKLMNRLRRDHLVVSDFGLLEGELLTLAAGRQGLT